MSVAEAHARISSSEFTEWLAFYGVEPFGEQRADLRSAIVATVTANVFGGSKQNQITVDDFMYNPVARKRDTKPKPKDVALKLMTILNHPEIKEKNPCQF